MSESGVLAKESREALRRLGMKGAVDPGSIRLLAGGMSGSSVVALTLEDALVILKCTTPSGRDPSRIGRATREVLFYRELVDRVPIRVPRMLASDLDPERGTLLLITAHEPPPVRWPAADFATVAHELGRFHTAMRNIALPSWVPAAASPAPENGRDAIDLWRAFAAKTEVVSRELLEGIEQMIARVGEVDACVDSGPLTLCHGDFHTGNLLRDRDGAWVWVDWQDIRIGPGVDDLAFLWQRSFAESEEMCESSYAAMKESYWEGLTAVGDPGMARVEFHQALAWSELRGWLIAWPPYLGYLSQAQQEGVVARIDTLLRERGN